MAQSPGHYNDPDMPAVGVPGFSVENSRTQMVLQNLARLRLICRRHTACAVPQYLLIAGGTSASVVTTPTGDAHTGAAAVPPGRPVRQARFGRMP
jgi:hypothetical protein